MKDDGLVNRREPLKSQLRRRRWSWSPWTVWLYGVPVAALFGGFLHYSGAGPFQSLTESLEREADLTKQIESLERQNDDLEREIEALMPGQFGLEKRAREQLGWSLPGEILIHIPEKQ